MNVAIIGVGIADIAQLGLDPATDALEIGLVGTELAATGAEETAIAAEEVAAKAGPSVFRTARLGKGQSELDNGLNPSDFSIGNRSAYVGDESAARTLANPRVGATRTLIRDSDPLAIGQIVHGEVVAHNPWGIEIRLEEVEIYGTVDIRFLSDEPADMNESRFPPLGERLVAKVQGMTPSGQLQLTIRQSDLVSLISLDLSCGLSGSWFGGGAPVVGLILAGGCDSSSEVVSVGAGFHSRMGDAVSL